jgi:hypothetical protein
MEGFGKHVVVLALAAVVAGGAQAQSGKQGPRASVSVATVCSLNKAVPPTLDVELRVRDKSSGTAKAEVRQWSISALAKTDSGKWSALDQFAQAGETLSPGTAVPPTGLSIKRSFPLCSLPDNTRGLNAMATVVYGLQGGGGESRTVMNMCSDDPETFDVIEPSGVKLSANDLNDIAMLCPR